MMAHGKTIRIVMADDHAILRAGLRMLLSSQRDMRVVAEAGDGIEAVHQVRTTRPDVVLLDLTMPEVSGAEIIEDILRESPKTRVLVLTMHTEPEYLHAALRAGASGYVLKRALDSDLLSAIRVTHKGDIFIDSKMNRFLVEQSLGFANGEVSSDRSRYELLTRREREVLKLAASGLTNRQIGETILISEKSVETYRGRVLRKLKLRDRAELVRFALRVGLLSSENHL